MNRNVTNKVEEKVVKFINIFRLEIEKCEDEMEYMDLISASLVFKDLIINHLKDSLRKDLTSTEEIDFIVKSLIVISEDISKNIILKIDEPIKESIN